MDHVHMHLAKKGANSTNSTIVADLLKTDLLKIVKFENTPHGVTIGGEVYKSDLQGPMKGKMLPDLIPAIKNETLQIDLHTKKHPDGELRGTIKMSGGNTTKQISGSANTTLSS
jgi:CHRD domain-containing protein